jgi:hypothetical protein
MRRRSRDRGVSARDVTLVGKRSRRQIGPIWVVLEGTHVIHMLARSRHHDLFCLVDLPRELQKKLGYVLSITSLELKKGHSKRADDS